MSKIIRLTESDLTRIIKRVIKEEELSSSTGDKNCVDQIRKLYSSNGFRDGGYYGDGEMHDMLVSYVRHTKGKTMAEFVEIKLTDHRMSSLGFIIEIQADGGDIKGNSTKVDPKVKNLISSKYKISSNDNDWDMRFISNELNCETAKTELVKNIKPLEQSLIQMGFKQVPFISDKYLTSLI